MDKKEIMEAALINFNDYEKRIIAAQKANPKIVERQSTALLKKMFDPAFREMVKLEIIGVATFNSDAETIAAKQIKKVVQS